jgi:hypothetical protein
MAVNLGQRTKDPADIRVYTVNWAFWLAPLASTLGSSVWTILPTGGAVDVVDTFTSTTTSIKVGAGVSGITYTIANTITTLSGETEKVQFTLRVTV